METREEVVEQEPSLAKLKNRCKKLKKRCNELVSRNAKLLSAMHQWRQLAEEREIEIKRLTEEMAKEAELEKSDRPSCDSDSFYREPPIQDKNDHRGYPDFQG